MSRLVTRPKLATGFPASLWPSDKTKRTYHLVLAGRDDDLASVAPLLDRCAGRFADPDLSIETEQSAEAVSALRAAETIGRALGSAAFLDRLAALTGRDPRPKWRGPKPGIE